MKLNLFLICLFRQSWPTRVTDMHQDIEDSLAASSISHTGGPQSPARSTESLLNGHRSKGVMELGRREETVTDSPGPPAQVQMSFSSPLKECQEFEITLCFQGRLRDWNCAHCSCNTLLYYICLFFFKISFQEAGAASSGPASGSGPGTNRTSVPSTSAAAKQRTCLFRSDQVGEFYKNLYFCCYLLSLMIVWYIDYWLICQSYK